MIDDPSNRTTDPIAPDTLETMLRARDGDAAGPRISLLVYHRDRVQLVSLAEGQSRVLGRDPSADISIADESVSRRHARIEVSGGEVLVVDLGSTNGVKLNGERVQRAAVAVSDEVTLGSVTISLHTLPPIDARRHKLWTHDQFLTSLEEEVERARTFSRSLAVLMVKLPGTEAGVLATRLRRELRPVDRLALYGDGILEVLVPEAGAEQAEKLVRAVAKASPDLRGGVAIHPASATSAGALLDLAREALRRASRAQPVQLASEVGPPVAASGPVIRSAAMSAIFDTVDRLASSVIPILILGETGTGKEIVARAVHERGPRRASRLASINCGAIPPSLVESVLLGYERGAFTGAQASSRGLFEEADGGTVLLDEVGDLPPGAQAALLRVLETKQVRRVGASQEVPVDVRVIAATNRDLEAMAKAGTFRSDLLYRLNAMTVEIPPLRERPEEIRPLAELFLTQANAANGRQVQGVDDTAMRLLHKYPWPGNIRELRNAIERAVTIATGKVVASGDLPRRVRDCGSVALTAGADEVPEAVGDLRAGVQRYETRIILDALRQAGGNRTEAARALGIPVRTLAYKIRQHGIKKLGFAAEEPGEP